mgnify:CR=1 FL=1
MGLEQLRNIMQPRLNISGMEKRVEGNEKGVKESLVYFNKEGKEFVLTSNFISKEKLEETKKKIQDSLSVLQDPDKVKASKDSLTVQLADIETKIGLIK